MEFWSDLLLTAALSFLVAFLLGVLFYVPGTAGSALAGVQPDSSADCVAGRERCFPARNEASGEAASCADSCLIEASAGSDGNYSEVSTQRVCDADEIAELNAAAVDEFGLVEGERRQGERGCGAMEDISSGRVCVPDVEVEVADELGPPEDGVADEKPEIRSKEVELLRETSQVQGSEILIQRCNFDLSAEEEKSIEKDPENKEEVKRTAMAEGVEIPNRKEDQEETFSLHGAQEDAPLIDDGDDDEWEGIERSELEKHFGLVNTYAGSEAGMNALSKLSRDLQLRLYGLHKIATEGPCHVPQPIALKMSARSRWQAWQRLGNMNPETAMEQYMDLLSENIPGWDREKLKIGIEKQEADQLSKMATSEMAASIDGSASTCERTLEGITCSEVKFDVTGAQNSNPGGSLELKQEPVVASQEPNWKNGGPRKHASSSPPALL